MSPRSLALLALLAPGCIFFRPPWANDEDEPDEAVSDSDDGEDPSLDTDDEVDDEPSPDPDDLTLYPSGGALGETLIASLIQHDEAGPALDAIDRVELYGPGMVTVLSLQHRTDDELLVVLQVDEASELGMHDLHVFLEDGSDLWVNDAFLVVRRPADAPQDYWPPEDDTDAGDTDAGADTDPPDTDADTDAP